MNNITPFDGGVLLLVLLAMLLARQPKQAAMSVCLAVSAIGMFLNYSVELGYLGARELFPLAANIQLLAAGSLFIGARWLKGQNQSFFVIMGYFLLVLGAINLTVSPGLITESVYVAASHIIAILHVATMLKYSNGFMDIIRNFRDFILGNGASSFSLRG